jgi:DNA-binding MarR family transcriptional regulator
MTKPAPTIGQKLTAKQLSVAVFIHAYQTNNDNMPSYKEISNAFGVQKNAALETVQRMIVYGVFERAENFSRYRFARTPAGAAYRAQIKARHIEQCGAA